VPKTNATISKTESGIDRHQSNYHQILI